MIRSTSCGICLLLLGLLSAGCASGALSQQREQQILANESTLKELMARGDASAAVGDMTRAEQYFVAALKAGGNERELVQRLLVVCVADQRYPVAAEYVEQYLHRHPLDTDLRFAAASLQVAIGDAPRARALLESVIQDRPQWAEAHYALASVLREEGEPDIVADPQDLEYLKLSPRGPLAEMARARLSHRGTP